MSYDDSMLTSSGSGSYTCLPDDLQFSLLEHNYVWQGVSTEPIPYSYELAREVQQEVIYAFNTDNPLLHHVRPDLISLCGNEIKRFICALYAYYKSTHPIMPKKYLFDGILDKNFATTLKKVKVKSYTRSFSLKPMEDDKLDDIPWFRIRDLGDIFNFTYWFFWEEDLGEDWKHTLIPVKPGWERYEEQFKEALEECLPDVEIPRILEEEILLSTSSSSSVTEKTLLKTKVWKEKEHSNYFSSDPLHGVHGYVRKRPGEIREIITLSVPQSNSVKLIEKQCAEIASKMTYSAYVKKEKDFTKLVESFWEENYVFLNRDLTKEGLTKPRHLLKWMLDVFEKHYPTFPAWRYRGIYKNLVIRVGDTDYQTLRGHGLGMANALTTVMQCAVFRMILKDHRTSWLGASCDGLFYNDDGTIGSDDRDALESYAEEEEFLLEELGLLRKENKTYYGELSVLCEKYSNPNLNRKESYWRYVRYLPFSACNIIHAKGLLDLAGSIHNPAFEPHLLEQLCQFFGYEHDRDEWNLPVVCGGGYTVRLHNTECSLLNMEYSHLLEQGAHVGKPNMKPFFKKKGKQTRYTSWMESRYRPTPSDPVIDRLYGVGLSRGDMEEKFHRGFSRQSLEAHFRNEYTMRQKRWKEKLPYSSWLYLYQKVVKDNDFMDILPPRACMKLVRLEDISVCWDEPVEFDLANPLVSGLNWFYDIGIKSEIPYPVIPGRGLYRSSSDKLTSFEQVLRSNDTKVPWLGYFKEDFIRFRERNWCCDEDVRDAYRMMTGDHDHMIYTDYPNKGASIYREAQTLIYHLYGPYGFVVRAGPIIGWDTVNGIMKGEIIPVDEPVITPPPEPRSPPVERPWVPKNFQEWVAVGKPLDHSIPNLFMYMEANMHVEYYEMCRTQSSIERAEARTYNKASLFEERELSHLETLASVCDLELLEEPGGKIYLRFPETDVFGGSDDPDDPGGSPVFGGLWD